MNSARERKSVRLYWKARHGASGVSERRAVALLEANGKVIIWTVSQIKILQAPRPAASRIKLAVSAGCETREAWLEGTVTTLACMRSAMKRCKSGLTMRSFVESKNEEGLDFQAGWVMGTPKHIFCDSGFWTAAMMAA